MLFIFSPTTRSSQTNAPNRAIFLPPFGNVQWPVTEEVARSSRSRKKRRLLLLSLLKDYNTISISVKQKWDSLMAGVFLSTTCVYRTCCFRLDTSLQVPGNAGNYSPYINSGLVDLLDSKRSAGTSISGDQHQQQQQRDSSRDAFQYQDSPISNNYLCMISSLTYFLVGFKSEPPRREWTSGWANLLAIGPFGSRLASGLSI